MRIGNHLPDNLKANGQYRGFYLMSKKYMHRKEGSEESKLSQQSNCQRGFMIDCRVWVEYHAQGFIISEYISRF